MLFSPRNIFNPFIVLYHMSAESVSTVRNARSKREPVLDGVVYQTCFSRSATDVQESAMTSTLFPSCRRTRTGTADSCTRAMISTSQGGAFRGVRELSY